MFEFDPAKSAANAVKHGIDFEQAQALWDDDRLLTLQSRMDQDEVRWLVIGRIGKAAWTAIITRRGEAIRIISVRRARKQELELYGH
jgi:uncharacterized DUF497 family protein